MGLVLLLLATLTTTRAHDSASTDDERRCISSNDCGENERCRDGTCKCWLQPCDSIVFAITLPCSKDSDCAHLLSFRRCIQGTCTCRRGYRPKGMMCEMDTEHETTTTAPREYQRRSPPDADYSGVVKLALGAAIVMLAGVILALVWNLYREKRRLARGVAQSGRRVQGRAGGRRTARHPPPTQDLPPNYNDIFIISASDSGHRHEKPPSYEEAMRDQQFRVLPSPGYVNFGFTSDITSPSSSVPPAGDSASHVIDMHQMGTRNPVTSLPSYPSPVASGNLSSLNVASIISRLRPSSLAEPSSSPSTPSGLLNVQMESPCRRALQGLSEPSVRRTMPQPPVTIRRTKSGKVSETTDDFYQVPADEQENVPQDSGQYQSPNSQTMPSSFRATTPEGGAHDEVPPVDCRHDEEPMDITPDGLKISEVQSSESPVKTQNTPKDSNSSVAEFLQDNNVGVCDIQDVVNVNTLSQSKNIDKSPQGTGDEIDKDYEPNNNPVVSNNNSMLIVSNNANAQEVPLGILHPTTVASEC